MDLEDKYNEWKKIFWGKFIIPDRNCNPGSNIPLSSINFGTSVGYVGDGTINMSDLLQYLYVCGLNKVDTPICIDDVLDSLIRLSESALEYYKYKFSNVYYIEEPGFFLRDDIDPLEDGFGLNEIRSSYAMLLNEKYDDPCHSPFISQDQVWNLNPILMTISRNPDIVGESVSSKACDLGIKYNSYIKDNGYIVYNPYLSAINHFFHYCPTFNEDKVKPWNRVTDRNDHLKYTDKVKRGANNWYYAGGTNSCASAFLNLSNSKSWKYNKNFLTFMHNMIVFLLDRVVEPLFGFKYNSYYCYGCTSGSWWGNYEKRLSNRFNKSLENDKESPFEMNLAYLINNKSLINWELVKNWMDRYPDPSESGLVNSPIQFMYSYEWYKLYTV